MITAYNPTHRLDSSASSMSSANPLGDLSGSIEGFVENSYTSDDEEEEGEDEL